MAHFLEIYISNEADWIVLIFRAKTSLQIATPKQYLYPHGN